MKQDQYKLWVIQQLEDWRDTFRDEEYNEEGEDENEGGWKELTYCIESLKANKCNEEVYELVLFHLWQKLEVLTQEEDE